ncbi:MAG: cell division FtsA domain-containing protein, partial [Alphaproteobacteria bacterium]|nr:cell division FtsA domain-containing protein [Alphaproteobacteria bacterium]
VERSGLKIKELFLQPIASKYAVTTPVDDEAGVAVLDIGGGTSDLAIFADKQFKHTSIIPFGGENITEDIRALGMIKSQAEKLKIDFGTAIPTEVQKNRFIAIPTLNGLKGIEINQYQLATVINRKMIEILEFINKKLADLQLYDKLSYGIIITGGGAILKDMKQLVEFKLGLNCRIGLPNLWVSCENNQELEKEIQKPLYATCVGLILLGFKTLYDNNISIVDNNQETTKQQNTLNITSVDPLPIINTAPLTQETILENEFVQNEPVIDKKPNDIKKRVGFLDGLKTSLIDLFSEEKDKNI